MSGLFLIRLAENGAEGTFAIRTQALSLRERGVVH